MTESTEAAKRKVSWRLWVLGGLAAFVGLPVLLFLAASYLADQTGIPPELKQLPPEIAALIAANNETTPTSGSLPRTSGTLTATSGTLAEKATPAVSPDGGLGELAFPVARGAHGDTSATYVPSYAMFLEAELRERPELEGARLYLDLQQPIREMLWGQPPGNSSLSPWVPGLPLPPECADLLVAQTDLIDRCLRLGESSGLPVRTAEIIASSPCPAWMATPTDLPLVGTILTAEGQRRLDVGDAAGAVRCWCAAIRLAANEASEPLLFAKMQGAASLDQVVLPFSCYVAANNAVSETLVRLQSLLAQVHRRFFSLHRLAQAQELEYLASRRYVLRALNSDTWRTPAFGWDVPNYPWLQAPGKPSPYIFAVGGTELPRLDRMLVTALSAMRLKRNSRRFLEEFDYVAALEIRMSQMSHPEWAVLRQDDRILRLDNPFLAQDPKWRGGNAFPCFFIQQGFRSDDWEAHLNLLRAAIEWRLAPSDAKPDPRTMTIEDRESPWRDPYSEQPFRAVDTADGVMLYSSCTRLKNPEGTEESATDTWKRTRGMALEVKR